MPILVGAVVDIGRATGRPAAGMGSGHRTRRLLRQAETGPLRRVHAAQDLVLASVRAGAAGRQAVGRRRPPGDLQDGPGDGRGRSMLRGGVRRRRARHRRTPAAAPLVVQTNNATYALTNLPPQQLAMSQLRAVEHNRAVVTAATTGDLRVRTPDGRVAWRTGELVSAVNVVQVPVRTATTLATRVGALPEWVLILMGPRGGRRRSARSGDSSGRATEEETMMERSLGRVLVIVPTYNERDNLPMIARAAARGGTRGAPAGRRRQQPGRHR